MGKEEWQRREERLLLNVRLDKILRLANTSPDFAISEAEYGLPVDIVLCATVGYVQDYIADLTLFQVYKLVQMAMEQGAKPASEP